MYGVSQLERNSQNKSINYKRASTEGAFTDIIRTKVIYMRSSCKPETIVE